MDVVHGPIFSRSGLFYWRNCSTTKTMKWKRGLGVSILYCKRKLEKNGKGRIRVTVSEMKLLSKVDLETALLCEVDG